MSAWIVIAATDLDDYLVGAQMTALRSSALAAGQADPFTAVMHDRANYVRNRLAGRVRISETDYAVPPELKGQTCLLIVEAMQGRLPVLKLTEDQRRQVERAYRDLDIAGTVDLPISEPDDPIEADVQQGATNASIVSKPTRVFTRDDMQGL